MNLRLQRFLELEQLSPARLADILGIQRSGISHILSGRNKPGYDFLYKMTQKFPTLNIEWLISGKGKVYKDQPQQPYQEQSGDKIKERDLFSENDNNSAEEEKTSYITKNESDINENASSEPNENRLNKPEQKGILEKKSLMKMILIYSDGTFEEYNPAD